MEDCLVKKLKGTVNNPNLLKLGEAVLHIVQTEAATYNIGSANSEAAMSIVEEGFYFTYNQQQVRTAPCNGDSVIFPAGDYHVSIKDKYIVNKLWNDSAAAGYIDISQFTYSPVTTIKGRFEGTTEDIAKLSALIQLVLRSVDHITGSLSDLKDMPNLQSVSIGNQIITGNIADLADFAIIKNGIYNDITLDRYTFGITGTLEGLVARLKQTIGISGSLAKMALYVPNATFGTYRLSTWNTSSADPTLQWDGDKIYYIGDLWVAAKGASAGEIAAWEQAGKTVTVIE